MQKGLAWVVADEHDVGNVIVLGDDRETALLPAVLYVAKGVKPPIYELPKQLANSGS